MTQEKKRGKLVVISGFSGVGKGTVVNRLLKDYDDYVVSVSMTTRQPREGEVDGVHYHFVTNEEFEKTIRENGFLEYAGYVDHHYGTPSAFVEKMLGEGVNVILEIEVQGAMQIKKQNPDAVLIFLTTKDAREMEKRLIGRKTDSEKQITGRFKRALEEAEHMKEYEYVVVNDDLDKCVTDVDRIIRTKPEGHRYDSSFKKTFLEDLSKIVEKRSCKSFEQD